MPELLRTVVAHLRAYVGNRRRPPRHCLRLTCHVALYDPARDSKGPQRTSNLDGWTRDLSASGLALVVPTVRIGERYLTGPDVVLHVRLEHPTGPLELLAAPVRYEPLAAAEAERGYLIGVRIKEIAAADRTRFETYLRGLS